MDRSLPRLYAITDRQRYGEDFIKTLRKVLSKGIKMVQLREKSLSAYDYYKLALEVRNITKEFGALLLINDRVDIALAVGADGVHLPKDGLPPRVVKELSPDLIVGFSAHSLEEALRAQEEGVDFITLSPIFKTSSHPEVEPLGLTPLKEVSERLSIPVYALGGIRWERIKLCYKNGAYGVAGIGLFLEDAHSGRRSDS
ncbi:MAG: thiamine phosphate synthase [Acidobacteria bacterium]|jgi:thiamine-phosphate pyrophosphorylase|nr:MAG: thiamine phosphate synthase [Acidobacteriota bacterium]